VFQRHQYDSAYGCPRTFHLIAVQLLKGHPEKAASMLQEPYVAGVPLTSGLAANYQTQEPWMEGPEFDSIFLLFEGMLTEYFRHVSIVL
jgi:hypothetical protein